MTYPTDLSDAEFRHIEPHLPTANQRGRPRIHGPPEILNAVFYVLKSGCPWRLLPRGDPNMRPELAAAFVAPFVAGLFGLIPLMVQIATTRAKRRDRMTRLNQLQAELEFLERLHALEGQVGAQDEPAKPRTDLAIGDALSDLWDQYNKLSKLAPPAGAGDEQTPAQQRSFLRRAFLLYTPQKTSGWILHTVFYMLAIFFVFVVFIAVALTVQIGGIGPFLSFMILYGIPVSIALLIIQRRARRNAAQNVAQSEEPEA